MKPYPAEIRAAFLQLRARGTSLGAISAELSIPKSTLNDWNNQLADEIARLRALEWEAIEEQFGRTLEQDLSRMAERIRKWEARIDRMNPDDFDIRQVMALLRETRREYFRRRAILMAPLERPSRSRSRHPDESGRFSISSDPQPRHTNHLQQLPAESSGSTPGILGGVNPVEPPKSLQRSETTQPNPELVGVPPSGRPSNDNSIQHASAENDPAPVPDQSQIDSLSSRLCSESPDAIKADHFFGSIVINPYECGAAVLLKTIEQEGSHQKSCLAELTSKPHVPNLRP